MRVGFDLDGIFIGSPPCIPTNLLEWLYRGPQKNGPHYRFPSLKLEQFLRELSHFYLLRPQIAKNTTFVKDLNKNKKHQLYLISSRYKFLEEKTYYLLKKYRLLNIFPSINLNIKNQQPHLFKKDAIHKLKIDLYIDDDLKLLKYLRQACPKTQLFWYNPGKKITNPDGIIIIKKLSEIEKFLK